MAFLAWGIVGLSASAIAANAALWALFGDAAQARPWLRTEVLLAWPMALAFAAAGGLVAARRPRNTYGWLLLAVRALWPVSGLLLDYAALAGDRGLPGADLAATTAAAMRPERVSLWLRETAEPLPAREWL